MRCRSSAPHTSVEQTKGYLEGMVARPTNGWLDFVLALPVNSSAADPEKEEEKEKEKVIGKLGIWSASKCEIGFMLNREYWGQGYMAEAMGVLIPELWKRGVEKVVADVDPRNEGSVGILKKFGFRETGWEERTGEVGGVWYDSLYFALERPGG